MVVLCVTVLSGVGAFILVFADPDSDKAEKLFDVLTHTLTGGGGALFGLIGGKASGTG